MAKTTMYMAKIDALPFQKWKDNKGDYNGRLMFQMWINYLSIPANFYSFLIDIEEEEKERTGEAVIQYKLVKINKKNWSMFLELCRNENMYANDMINILIRKFNSKGYCIETNIKV